MSVECSIYSNYFLTRHIIKTIFYQLKPKFPIISLRIVIRYDSPVVVSIEGRWGGQYHIWSTVFPWCGQMLAWAVSSLSHYSTERLRTAFTGWVHRTVHHDQNETALGALISKYIFSGYLCATMGWYLLRYQFKNWIP